MISITELIRELGLTILASMVAVAVVLAVCQAYADHHAQERGRAEQARIEQARRHGPAALRQYLDATARAQVKRVLGEDVL